MNENIKRKILDKKLACKYIINANNKNYDAYFTLQIISTGLSAMIIKSKNNYHFQLSEKFKDPETSATTYWSILKTFYNGKRMPIIPPILVNNNLISNFKGALSGLRQFLATESPLKTMKYAFYFTSKALFVLKIFKFLS